MKILFTKTGIENEVSKKMGTDFVFDFQDFIKIEHLKTKPFELKNYSLIFSSVNAVKSFFKNKFYYPQILQLHQLAQYNHLLKFVENYALFLHKFEFLYD